MASCLGNGVIVEGSSDYISAMLLHYFDWSIVGEWKRRPAMVKDCLHMVKYDSFLELGEMAQREVVKGAVVSMLEVENHCCASVKWNFEQETEGSTCSLVELPFLLFCCCFWLLTDLVVA